MFRPLQFPQGTWILSFMWVSTEGQLLIFSYKCYQGWGCVREAGEAAKPRFTKIISFSALSCQRCQPSLSQLSHGNSWFLTTMTEVKAKSRLGIRKCRWGQSRAAIWFYSSSKVLFHQQPSCFGRFLPSFLSSSSPFCTSTPTRGFCPSSLHSVNWQYSCNKYNQGSRNLWCGSGTF